MIYCYGRVSTDEQGNSIDNQRQKLEAYARGTGLPFGGVFLDEDQSAFNIPLRRRREGKVLWDLLQTGDTVVIPAVDRAFRSNSDAWNTLDSWHSQGIKLVLMDMNIDTSTPDGELVFGIRLSSARYESRMNSKRQKEIFAYLRRQGRPYGGLRPYGWVRSGKEWAVCEQERRLGDRLISMRGDGLSWQQIALAICKEGIQKPIRKKNCRGWYVVSDLWSLHRAAVAGYPKTPQAIWSGGQRATTPPAAATGDLSQASAG